MFATSQLLMNFEPFLLYRQVSLKRLETFLSLPEIQVPVPYIDNSKESRKIQIKISSSNKTVESSEIFVSI